MGAISARPALPARPSDRPAPPSPLATRAPPFASARAPFLVTPPLSVHSPPPRRTYTVPVQTEDSQITRFCVTAHQDDVLRKGDSVARVRARPHAVQVLVHAPQGRYDSRESRDLLPAGPSGAPPSLRHAPPCHPIVTPSFAVTRCAMACQHWCSPHCRRSRPEAGRGMLTSAARRAWAGLNKYGRHYEHQVLDASATFWGPSRVLVCAACALKTQSGNRGSVSLFSLRYR